MAIAYYKGLPISGSGLQKVSMTRAEYERDKEALDESDLLIEITDEDLEPIDADDIAYGEGTVGDAIGQINNDLSELSKMEPIYPTVTERLKNPVFYKNGNRIIFDFYVESGTRNAEAVAGDVPRPLLGRYYPVYNNDTGAFVGNIWFNGTVMTYYGSTVINRSRCGGEFTVQ